MWGEMCYTRLSGDAKVRGIVVLNLDTGFKIHIVVVAELFLPCQTNGGSSNSSNNSSNGLRSGFIFFLLRWGSVLFFSDRFVRRSSYLGFAARDFFRMKMDDFFGGGFF